MVIISYEFKLVDEKKKIELITNYNHCLDLTANYFERKVVVHYSIYDASGKQLKGDAVTVTFSTGETSVDDIIAKNFPVISDYFNQSVYASVNQSPVKTK
ncbi:MAG: hypothetical protein H7Y00_02515 [Fimbriimonadaceae bacterium]|nr:hypothetical protein [Chitinophagales bacterium]